MTGQTAKEKRTAMTDNLLKQLGAGKKKQSGIITKELKEKKEMMNRKYEEEQTTLQRRIDEISAFMIEEDSKSDNAEQFIKMIMYLTGR